MKRPTPEECAAKATLPAEPGETYAFAAWHPQWGGYVGCSVVTFGTASDGGVDARAGAHAEPGCFDVHNWHDGEFPRDDHVTTYHYCAAEQLVEFGLLVLERQCEHQVDTGGRAVRCDTAWIDRTIARLQALRAMSVPPCR